MASTRSYTQNQISRFSRLAIKNSEKALASGKQQPQPPTSFSTEPVSKFKLSVENTAFEERNTRRSILYKLHGEKFPYLQHMMKEIDFGMVSPALVAAIYITARTRTNDWHLICAQENAANYVVDEAIVENVNGYFKAAQEPLSDELHEMHNMFETFMQPTLDDITAFKTQYAGKNFRTMTFLSATSKFDLSPIADSFRQYETHINAKREVANESTWELVFRTFQQNTSWFSKQ